MATTATHREACKLTWQSPDGGRRRVLHWPSVEKRGAIVIAHGHGEHVGRYQRFVEALSDLPVDFIGYDHLGHGESDGQRGDADGIDALADDLSTFLPFARKQTGCDRLLIHGHSMGAVVTARLLTLHRLAGVVAAAVLSDPAFVVPTTAGTRAKIALGRLVALVAPRASFRTGLNPDFLSRDPEVVLQYRNDPLVHDRISARLGKSLIDVGEACTRESAKCDRPLLVYHGAADRIADIRGTRRFVDNADPTRVEYHEIEGFYHEPHNEPPNEAAKVYTILRAWLSRWLT